MGQLFGDESIMIEDKGVQAEDPAFSVIKKVVH